MVKINSEWDLGIEEYYESEELAKKALREEKWLEDEIGMTFDKMENENLITYEEV